MKTAVVAPVIAGALVPTGTAAHGQSSHSYDQEHSHNPPVRCIGVPRPDIRKKRWKLRVRRRHTRPVPPDGPDRQSRTRPRHGRCFVNHRCPERDNPPAAIPTGQPLVPIVQDGA